MRSLRLFALNAIQFCVISANMRAIAQGRYAAAFITDVVVCVIAFSLTKYIVEAKTWTDRIAYALGGAIGAQVAIYATRIIFGS